MALDPTDNLKRVSVQLTDEQRAWLIARARRLGVRSLAAAARMVIQEAMNVEAATRTKARAS